MRRSISTLSDAELVTSFLEARDQHAFAELVCRHGPMVHATAQRVLCSREDAEDAVQATFLAFAKAAGSLREKSAVGGWLHSTAIRCATSIRKERDRWNRNVDEHVKRTAHSASGIPRMPAEDVLEVLDAEISRLPQKLRTIIVLCGLEARARKEVAIELGIPPKTVTSRMTAARKLLKSRLARRGVTFSLISLLSAAASKTNAATVSSATANEITVGALRYIAGESPEAMGISKVALHAATEVTMSMAKIKLVTATLLIIASLTTMGTVGGFAISNTAAAKTLYYEDFSSGNASIAAWTTVHVGLQPSVDASTGDFVIAQESQGGFEGVVATVTGVPAVAALRDTSIRSQVALQGRAEGIQLSARFNEIDATWYQGGYDPEGKILYIGYNDPEYHQLAKVDADFDLAGGQELVLQFDVIGNQLSVWAWRPEDAPPAQPQVTHIDNTVNLVAGVPGVGIDPAPSGTVSSVTFKYLKVGDSTIPVPEPASPTSLALATALIALYRLRN